MKIDFEKVSIIDGLAIIAIGIGFVAGVMTGQENIALTCVGALSGYIGAVYNGARNSSGGKDD